MSVYDGLIDRRFVLGADVNAISKQHGNTALLLAAGRLHKHVTERLLLAGAAVNTAGKVLLIVLSLMIQCPWRSRLLWPKRCR